MRLKALGLLLLAACVSAPPPPVELASADKVSLVICNSDEARTTWYGTCFPYRQDKLLDGTYKVYYLTAAHNVAHSIPTANYLHEPPLAAISVQEPISFEDIKAFTLEYVSDTVDFAVISIISAKSVDIFELEFAYPVYGDEVIAVGFPRGKGVFFSEGKIMFEDTSNNLQMSNSTTIPGMSGGPVVLRSSGKVVGIIHAIDTVTIDGFTNMVWNFQHFVPIHHIYPALKAKGLL